MSSVLSGTDARAVPGRLYGLVAEFETPEEIIAAAKAVRNAGYTQAEAYSPFPVEGLDTAVGHRSTGLGFVTLIAGTVGVLAGFFMQWYANVIFYPLNIGGRPLNSWPNFIIISFEVSVLFAALASVAYMIIRNGLPRAYHPIFNTPGFENATRDRFFLCIEADDRKFDLDRTRAFLEKQDPLRVSEVER
jgi:hypothetical protein